MIEVDNLTKYFGPVLAVDRVSFQVDKGEIVGFLGPNGAGKTTTMRILTTFLPATSGIAKVANHDVMTESMAVRRNIGYLPESIPLYSEMRVEEYLLYRAKLKGVPRKARQQRLDYCLERCRIREVRRRLCATLSKGYRQRVGLADAMIHDPQILIMDEPTSGLDPIQIHETLALIRELGENHTILLSTHILSEVELVCERVIIINAGRVNFSESLEELESHAVILLEVRGPKQDVTNLLRGLEGVTDVAAHDMEDGLCGYEVETHQDQDIREKVFQALAKRNWPLRRLERKRARLEDAFFEVIREQDPLKERITARPPAAAASEHVQDLKENTAGSK
jgi:ABC-2 type transport system ATP-binding protein